MTPWSARPVPEVPARGERPQAAVTEGLQRGVTELIAQDDHGRIDLRLQGDLRATPALSDQGGRHLGAASEVAAWRHRSWQFSGWLRWSLQRCGAPAAAAS
jgi:hypothetical protein